MLKILIVGDTPGISFLTWRLASLGDSVQITLVSRYFNKKSYWQLNNEDRKSFNIHGDIFVNMDQFEKAVPKDVTFDVVIITCPTFPIFRNSLASIECYTNSRTLFLVDGYIGVATEAVVHEAVPTCTCFTFLCDVDVRFLGDSTFLAKLNEVCVWFGYTANFYSSEIVCKSTNRFLKRTNTVLDTFIALIENEALHIKATKSIQGVFEIGLNTIIWKRCILEISINLLALVFSTLNLTDVYKDPAINPVFKGVISELVAIAKKSGAPNINAILMNGDTYEETTLYHSIALIARRRSFEVGDPYQSDPTFLKFPLAFYQFVHNYQNYSFITLFQTLLLSDALNLPNPSLSVLYGILKKLFDCGTSFNIASSQKKNKGVTQNELKPIETSIPKSKPIPPKQPTTKVEDPPKEKVTKIKYTDDDYESDAIDEELAGLFFATQQIPFYHQQEKEGSTTNVKNLPTKAEQLTKKSEEQQPQQRVTEKPILKTEKPCITESDRRHTNLFGLSETHNEYEEEMRELPDNHFNIGILPPEAATEDGMTTIDNEVTAKSFHLDDGYQHYQNTKSPRPMSATPRSPHYRKAGLVDEFKIDEFFDGTGFPHDYSPRYLLDLSKTKLTSAQRRKLSTSDALIQKLISSSSDRYSATQQDFNRDQNQ